MKTFFENINFTFGTKDSDIKPSEIIISENDNLTKRIKNKVFIFDNSKQINSSFYVITVPLVDKELFELRRYIWNENKHELYFLAEKPETNLITTLYYAKNNPREPEIKIESFSGDEKDCEKLEKIKKWNFESGAFWLAYSDFLDTIKNSSRVDEKLIVQLKELKKKLKKEVAPIVKISDEIVQALIDRTLFIKFLEDNHIINSFFYNFHFPNRFSVGDIDFGYKRLLQERDIENINKLFDEINKLFNNVLFKTPSIEKEYLTGNNVLNLIYQAIRQVDWTDGQLSLFDFRFDVIPIQFISHIYEVFLEGKQADEGIYYTPDKLAHLIIDETITGFGTVLDPACGSGMFLVLAFRKLLEYNTAPKTENIYKIIEHKNKLLKDCIFGIEKENTAWRLTVFSLYLEIFKDISATEIKKFIEQKLESKSVSPIFELDFSENIQNCNALEVTDEIKPHKGNSFDYIVGNPPFLEIKPKSDEINFLNETIEIEGKTLKVKDIIGHNQISQAFMLKIKDWAKPETRFGFVQNNSNFYNEDSLKFQKFFFANYLIETLYELSRVKNILFRKAKQGVLVTIFNNRQVSNNSINYFPVDMGIFSENFDLLIIQEDKKIDLLQIDILDRKIVLRDYLIGNEHDLKLLNKLSSLGKLNEYLLKDKNYDSFRGLTRLSNEDLNKFFKKTDEVKTKEKVELHKEFAKTNYLNETKTEYYNTPYVYQPENKIKAFCITDVDGYVNKKDVNKTNFQRPRNIFIYAGNKIIFNKFGKKIEAAFAISDLFFSNLIYGIKLQDEKYYYLFTAILNSDLVNFFLSQKYRKRIDENFANLDTKAIKNIPIPKKLDEDLVAEISEISKQLTDSKGKLKYEGETKEKLNELICNLYDLGYLERQRIRDYFSTKRTIEKTDLDVYKKTLYSTLEMYFKSKPTIESYQNPNLGFNMVVTAIYFNNSKQTMPTTEKTFKYIISEILRESKENFITLKEKIKGNDCIYIVKDNQYKNWTETKAFEDGKEILKLVR